MLSNLYFGNSISLNNRDIFLTVSKLSHFAILSFLHALYRIRSSRSPDFLVDLYLHLCRPYEILPYQSAIRMIERNVCTTENTWSSRGSRFGVDISLWLGQYISLFLGNSEVPASPSYKSYDAGIIKRLKNTLTADGSGEKGNTWQY